MMLRRLLLAALLAAGCHDEGGAAADGSVAAMGDGGGSDLAVADPLCAVAPADATASRERARSCGVGAEAALMLRRAPYSRVVVEVVPMMGTTPRQAALDHLVQVFGDVTDKPAGVTITVGTPIAPVGHPLTLAEIGALEDGARTRFAGGDTAVFFYMVVSDAYSEDTSSQKVLGLAYRASSMVVFQKTIESISGGIGQPSADVVESTVVAHELGHVLGLVNLGVPMQQPHQDTAHGAHDTNTSCLMYWANNSSQLLANLLSGGVVPDFDAQCRADLAAVRGN